VTKRNETPEQRITRLQYAGGWIGVDLDGTLAHYDTWRGPLHIGDPIPVMQQRVINWLKSGVEVRVFTARGGLLECQEAIRAWCFLHLGQHLPITNTKDFQMIELWDDRAVQVIPNTGLRVDGLS
jgi:hypothetical protein